MKMDHRLMENTRMSYKLLERQFRAGARNRLIYQAGFELLKKDPALFSTLDPFTLQIFAWASAHGFLTPEMALMAAGQAGSVRRWSLLSMKLLKCLLSDCSVQGDGWSCVRSLYPWTADGPGGVCLVSERCGTGCKDHESL